jgi:hypothetical protein
MEAKAEQDRPAQGSRRRVAPKPVAKWVSVTMQTAALAGLTEGKKEKRLSWRANDRLVQAAEERSGLEGSDLLEYALVKVALEDGFAEELLALKGTVSRDVDLEF